MNASSSPAGSPQRAPAERPLRVLGLAGSLRLGSYNRALLRAAQELAPDGVKIEPYELADLPFYHGDVEAAGDPASVARLKEAVRGADALLIATPEYNSGLPAVIKNAVDWASRPPRASVLAEKPVAIIGASRGRGGTRRAQLQLLDALVFSGAATVAACELRVAEAHTKFDDQPEPSLTDEDTRRDLKALLAVLDRAVREPRPPARA